MQVSLLKNREVDAAVDLGTNGCEKDHQRTEAIPEDGHRAGANAVNNLRGEPRDNFCIAGQNACAEIFQLGIVRISTGKSASRQQSVGHS
jgi:hypothetical protein